MRYKFVEEEDTIYFRCICEKCIEIKDRVAFMKPHPDFAFQKPLYKAMIKQLKIELRED